MRKVRLVGHRGLPSNYPENTLESYKGAIREGVDSIEFDVHRTTDNILVVTHDDTLERCSTGKGPVREKSYAELLELDFGSWKGKAFAGTKIPTLEQVLDTIVANAPETLEILVELKENDDLCTEMTGKVLAERKLFSRCKVLSFYANQLILLHKLYPGCPLQGFRMDYFKFGDPKIYDILSRVCIWRKDLSKENIDFFHARHIEVDTCPVDNAEQLETALKYDIDTITSNASNLIAPLLRNRAFSAWQLHGAGLDSIGTNGKPDTLTLPAIKEDEILVKIEALGLCFSDIKIIRAGENHPKILSKDLKANPLIPGHEAVMTVVKSGSAIPPRFAPGNRYLIQCDIFIKGESRAYGYCMDGGLSEYSILDRRVWEGEAFSYLIDAPEHLSRAATSLIEPWTCVNASYRIEHRTAPAENGRVLIVCGKNVPTDLQAGTLLKNASPSVICALGLPDVSSLENELGKKIEKITHLPENTQFTDIFFVGSPEKETGEKAISLGARGCIFTFIGDFSKADWLLDAGALHYKRFFYQGTLENNLSSAYALPRRKTLFQGGCAWFLGGAGAMGQMHVQLAVESAGGPAKILVSDLDPVRIAHVKENLSPLAEKRGVELVFVNPGTMTAEAFEKFLEEFAPRGFDDIVLLVPSAKAADQAVKHLGDNGLMNIFAGIPAGECMGVSVDGIAASGKRFTGSSGSGMDDMLSTLDKTAKGELRTERALAAVAGMNHAGEGLKAVAEGRFPGKIVVYPQCPDLPLVQVKDLALVSPAAAALLDADSCLTPEAENALLKEFAKK